MVQIIKGSYGLRVGKTIQPVNAGDAPISLSEEEEKRLIRLGVAVKVSEHAESEPTNENKNAPEKKGGKPAGKKGKGKTETEEESVDETEEAVAPEDLPNLDANDAVVDE